MSRSDGSVITESLKHACMADVNVVIRDEPIGHHLEYKNMNQASVMFFNQVNTSNDVENKMKEKVKLLKNVSIRVTTNMNKKQRWKKREEILKIFDSEIKKNKQKFNAEVERLRELLTNSESMSFENLLLLFILNAGYICERKEDGTYAILTDDDLMKITDEKEVYVMREIIIVCYYNGKPIGFTLKIDDIREKFTSNMDKYLKRNEGLNSDLSSKFIFRRLENGDLEYFDLRNWNNKTGDDKINYFIGREAWTFIVSDEDLRKYDQCVVGTRGLKWRKLLFGGFNHVHTGDNYFLLFTTNHDVLGYVRSTNAKDKVNKLLQKYSIRYYIIWTGHEKNEVAKELLFEQGSADDTKFVSNLPKKETATEAAAITLDFKTKDYYNLYKKPARLPLYFDFRSIKFCVGDVLQEDHLVYGYDERRKRLKTLKLGAENGEAGYDIPSTKLLRQTRPWKVGDIAYLHKQAVEVETAVKNAELLLTIPEHIQKLLKIVVFVRSSGVLNGKICPRVYTMPYDAIWQVGHRSKVDCYYEHELIFRNTSLKMLGMKKDLTKSYDMMQFLRWDVLQWWRQQRDKSNTYAEMFSIGMSCTEIINLLQYEEDRPEEAMLFEKKYGLKNIGKVSDLKKNVYCFEDYVRRIPMKDVFKHVKSKSTEESLSTNKTNVGVMCENIKDMSNIWMPTSETTDTGEQKWLVSVKSYYDSEWEKKKERGVIIHDGRPQWRYYYGSSENKESYYRLDRCEEKIVGRHPISTVGDKKHQFTVIKFGPVVAGTRQTDGWYKVKGVERKFFSSNVTEEKVDWRSAVTQAIINEVEDPKSDLGFKDVDEDIITALKNQLKSGSVEAEKTSNPNFSKEYNDYPLYGPGNMSKDDFLEMEYKRLKLIYFGLNGIDMPIEPMPKALVLNQGWIAETDAKGTTTYVRGEEKLNNRPLASLLRPEEWIITNNNHYYNMRSKKKINSLDDLHNNENAETIPIMRREFVASIYDAFYKSKNEDNIFENVFSRLKSSRMWKIKDNSTPKYRQTLQKLNKEKLQQIQAYLTYVKNDKKKRKERDEVLDSVVSSEEDD